LALSLVGSECGPITAGSRIPSTAAMWARATRWWSVEIAFLRNEWIDNQDRNNHSLLLLEDLIEGKLNPVEAVESEMNESVL